MKFTNCEKKLFEIQRDFRVSKKCEEEFLNFLLKQDINDQVKKLIKNKLTDSDMVVSNAEKKGKIISNDKNPESNFPEKKHYEDKIRALLRQIEQFEERNQLLIDEIDQKQKQIENLKENDSNENITNFVGNIFLRIQKILQLLNPDIALDDGENLENVFGILENYIEDFKIFCNRENNELILKLAELEKTLVQKDEEIFSLQSNLSNYEAQASKTKIQRENFESEKKKLEKKIEVLSSQKEEITDKLIFEESKKNVEQLTLLKEQLLLENEQIKASAQKYVKELQEMKAILKGKEEEIEGLLSMSSENKKTMTSEFQKFKKLLDESSKQIEELSTENEELKALHQKSNEESLIGIHEYKKKVEELQALNLHYMTQCKEQERQLLSLSQTQSETEEKLEAEKVAFDTERKKMGMMLSDQKDLINTLRKQLDTHKAKEDELTSKLKSFSNQELKSKEEKNDFFNAMNTLLQEKEKNLLQLESELLMKEEAIEILREQLLENNVFVNARNEEINICIRKLQNCNQQIQDSHSLIYSNLIDNLEKLFEIVDNFGKLYNSIRYFLPKKSSLFAGMNKLCNELSRLYNLNEESLKFLNSQQTQINGEIELFSINRSKLVLETFDNLTSKLTSLEEEQKVLKEQIDNKQFDFMEDVNEEEESNKALIEEELIEANAKISYLETKVVNLENLLQVSQAGTIHFETKDKPIKTPKLLPQGSENDSKSFKDEFDAMFNEKMSINEIRRDSKSIQKSVLTFYLVF